MNINVNTAANDYDFEIAGASYIGAPKSNSVMFITCKVAELIHNLFAVSQCLVYVENGIDVPEEIEKKNCIIYTDSPQWDYTQFVSQFAELRLQEEKKRKYTLTNEGYYIGENVMLGENCYIEPGCLIGHDVVIGKNARILSGAIVKNARIGNNVLINEKAVVGAFGFTMTEDGTGNKVRIPTLGRVMIGDYVEIGVQDNISCGSGGDTLIDDYVKIDAFVHIGHDAHLYRNVEITAGAVIGGFSELQEGVYVGLNATVRNRICLQRSCVIGMGSTVTKSVEPRMTVVGNPARVFVKKEK
ncbi:MAG: hypothetical protein NC300_02110 [Bacteroidales bacterium]|nr:hypothetical protein [Clostridium sp.]MCM1202919.1 hypothetical protein [Bacteroidales bacterium]